MKPTFTTWLLMGLFAFRSFAAEEFAGTGSALAQRVEAAAKQLAELQSRIETEKVPLIKERNNLEAEVIALRQEVERKEALKNGAEAAIKAAERDLKASRDEVAYLTGLLKDYTVNFEARVHASEMQRFKELIAQVKPAADDPNLTDGERFKRQLPILRAALQRLEGQMGGETFAGSVLNPAGILTEGTVALVGPVGFFTSKDGANSGVIEFPINSPEPVVVDLGEQSSAGIKEFVTRSEGTPPIDTSLGNAFKAISMELTLFEKLEQGGLVMIPLLGLGAAALLVGFVKWLQFARVRLTTEADLQTVLRHLEKNDQDKALAHARGISGPAGDMLAAAVEYANEKKEHIEEIVYEKMLAARTRLERGLAFLSLTATTGPLLGLLGTVTGMIATFKLISSFGSGDPKLLAAGISEALIATATGMAVAIPALLLHAFLSRKAKGIIGSMEQTAVGFINGITKQS